MEEEKEQKGSNMPILPTALLYPMPSRCASVCLFVLSIYPFSSLVCMVMLMLDGYGDVKAIDTL